MAIVIRGRTKYAICNSVIEQDTEVVATQHFIPDKEHPLWRFSDAAMHSQCFIGWEYRIEFIETYNGTVGQIVWGNGTHHHMRQDGVIETVASSSVQQSVQPDRCEDAAPG